MASLGRDALFFAPHISLLPSLVIIAIVLCVNLLGDALRDLLDPRMRNEAKPRKAGVKKGENDRNDSI